MSGERASYRHRVAFTPGSIAGVLVARKRHVCGGHLASERHYIEPGQRYVANALPPDHPEIGNPGWWHLRVCMDCCPERYVPPAEWGPDLLAMTQAERERWVRENSGSQP